jgi:hypothetical protein
VHLGKLTRFRYKKLKYLHDDLDPATEIGGERDELDEPDDQGDVDQQLMEIILIVNLLDSLGNRRTK